MLMTDTFPSGFSTPLGATQDAGESTGDVTSTLAELERKLRELERELTSIGRRRVRPEGEGNESFAPPTHGMSERAGLTASGRLVDERVEPARAPAPLQAPPPSRHVAQPTQPPLPPRQMAPPPTRPAPEPSVTSEGERPRPTEAQLAALAELRRFSERLERFTKELTADYDAVLAHVMAVLSGRVPPEPPAHVPPAPDPPVSVRAPAPEPAPAISEEPLFEGRVELGVGPFYDIGSLSAFEQRVASMPNVSEVSVRRFEASHAVVDLRLAAPVALLSELQRVLDTDFGVRQVAPGRITLSFDEI